MTELTEEEKERIEAEETYRAKVREELKEEPKKIKENKTSWWKPKGLGAWLFVIIIILVIFVSFIGKNQTQTGINNYNSSTPTQDPEQEKIWIKDQAKIYCDNHKKQGLKIPNVKQLEDKTKPDSINGESLTSSDCEKITDWMSEHFTKEDMVNIAKGSGWIGMTPYQLMFTIGLPWDENKTVMKDYVHVQWVYGNPIYGANYYYFEGSSPEDMNTWKLTSMQD